MTPTTAEDIRSDDAAERLLEDSWETRSRGVDRRELLTELVAGGLFLLGAVALLFVPGATAGFDVALAVALVVLYALVSRVEFPVGAGYVFPSQLVLVPMLLLLPPATVPLLVAAGLVIVRLYDLLRRRGSALRLLFAIPDAWHALGPALVLVIAGAPQLDLSNLPLLGAALLVGCLFDAGSATLREAAARGIAPAASDQGARARRDGRRLPGADRLPRGPRRQPPRGRRAPRPPARRAADAAGARSPRAHRAGPEPPAARDPRAQPAAVGRAPHGRRLRRQARPRRARRHHAARLDRGGRRRHRLPEPQRLRAALPARGRARGPARRAAGRGRRRDRERRAPSSCATPPAGRSPCPSGSPHPTD